jgi:heat shock protein HslJ
MEITMLCAKSYPRFSLVLILAALMMLAACQPATPPTPTPELAEQVAQAAEGLSLIGTSWQAEAFGGPEPEEQVLVMEDTRMTVNFGIERYAGNGGCNWFLGVYSVEGVSMRFMTPAQTRIYCEPDELMQQEATFMSSLWNIIEYRMDGEKLLGYTTGDQLLLTLVPADPVAFEGTTWTLAFQDYGNGASPFIPETEVTAVFNAGELSGSGGCNTYSTTYTLDGQAFDAAEVVSTRMACEEPEGVMDQETRFLQNLQDATKLIQTGSLLQLVNAEDETIAILGAR